MIEKEIKIANQAYNAMIEINPKKLNDHIEEDFVIENFMDRCRDLGFNGNYNKLADWFNNK